MTDKYAVIGNPIAHSKSPQIHKMFAKQTGQDISYEAILAPLDGFAATVERLHNEGYKGCNVTVPFKEHAFQLHASQLNIPGITISHSDEVDYAKAANTLKFSDETIEIRNTDGVGLVNDLEKNLNVKLAGKRLLLIGAGGAAKGVLWPLRRANANITITNRTVEKIRFLAGHNTSVCSYGELSGKLFDIVINATSAGLSDENPLPNNVGNIFAPGALAYDMMYGRETPFMKFAHEQGAQVSDGLGMLVEQAAEAFYIWRGVRPETAPVIAALRV